MSFDHDRPDPLRPDEWEYTTLTCYGATILVSKVGGGTLGRAYDGAWHYSYTYRDRHECGSDLVTNTPHTHEAAAGMVVDFFEEEDSA